MLQRRFGPLTGKQLAEARAYAYGGSLIQDLGYYPFGSRLFTDLMHYVRAGDFVESLIAGATTPTNMPSPSARWRTTTPTAPAIRSPSTAPCR